jgi:hypothetical protein
MVNELHLRGYGKLRVVPSLSPTGLAWRCIFVTSEGATFIASNCLENFETSDRKIEYTPERLADIFVVENRVFIDKCMGKNEDYVRWYNAMTARLSDGELPFAFADYFSPGDFWKTSKGNMIETLPGEKKYYFNY